MDSQSLLELKVFLIIALFEGVLGRSITDACRGRCDNLVGYFCHDFLGNCESCIHCVVGAGYACAKKCREWKNLLTSTVATEILKRNTSTIVSQLSNTQETATQPSDNSTVATGSWISSSENTTANSTSASNVTDPKTGGSDISGGYLQLSAELMISLLVVLLIFVCIGKFVLNYYKRIKQNANPDIEMQPVARGRDEVVDPQPNARLLEMDDDYIGNGRSILTPPVSVEHEDEPCNDDPCNPMLPGASTTQPAPVKEAGHSLSSSTGQSARLRREGDSGFGTGAATLHSQDDIGAGTSQMGPPSAVSKPGILCSHQGSARMTRVTKELQQGAIPFEDQRSRDDNIQMSLCVQDGTHNSHEVAVSTTFDPLGVIKANRIGTGD